jgi:hypothetical protein
VLLGDEAGDIEHVAGDEQQGERRQSEQEQTDELGDHVAVEGLHRRKLSPR